MNTAHWIPDLFMKRVCWKTALDPVLAADVPDLHDRFGADFEAAYLAYEDKASAATSPHQDRAGHGPVAQDADHAVRNRPSMDHLQGSPATCARPSNMQAWCTRPTCARKSPSTPATKKPRCNLGSVNLARHIKDGGIDHDKLRRTTGTAMRMLDNVIDINYYAVKKARDANLRHRPVGWA